MTTPTHFPIAGTARRHRTSVVFGPINVPPVLRQLWISNHSCLSTYPYPHGCYFFSQATLKLRSLLPSPKAPLRRGRYLSVDAVIVTLNNQIISFAHNWSLDRFNLPQPFYMYWVLCSRVLEQLTLRETKYVSSFTSSSDWICQSWSQSYPQL